MSGAKSVPILEVVRQYSGIELTQKGREYWGLRLRAGEPAARQQPELHYDSI